ncbi:MAG: retropepsin-like aspartic protease [Sphingomonas sp.]
MRRRFRAGALAFIPLLIGAAPDRLPPLPDPYAAPPRGVVMTMLRQSQFGAPGADETIEAWLAAHPDAPKPHRAALWHRLCSDYGVRGAYADDLRACTAEAAVAPPGEADDDIAMARALQDEPPVRASGAAIVPLIQNRLGSRSVNILVNGYQSPWFVDSGAEVSVLSQSVADRIKVRLLPDSVRVDTTTASVSGRMGMVDLLRIGDATVENLPVLVLPDRQLTIAGMPTIPAILGLPALVAFHRVAWLDRGGRLALGNAAPVPGTDAQRLYWHEEGVGVPISTARGTLGAQLDSGANATYLRTPGRALLSRAQLRSAVSRDRGLGGAGGLIRMRHKVVPRLMLRLAGAPLRLTDVSIVEQDRGGAGRIGDDAIAQLAELTLDFDRMRVAARAAPGKL